jgi:hypothetical protein
MEMLAEVLAHMVNLLGGTVFGFLAGLLVVWMSNKKLRQTLDEHREWLRMEAERRMPPLVPMPRWAHASFETQKPPQLGPFRDGAEEVYVKIQARGCKAQLRRVIDTLADEEVISAVTAKEVHDSLDA